MGWLSTGASRNREENVKRASKTSGLNRREGGVKLIGLPDGCQASVGLETIPFSMAQAIT